MKRVTLTVVASTAGVSVQTASHILNTAYRHLYKEETQRQVRRVARQLGYRPNAAARAMLHQRSHIIGIIVPASAVPGWFQLVDIEEMMLGMHRPLAQAGYVVSVIPVDEGPSPGTVSRALREQLLDGMLVAGWMPERPQDFHELHMPILWCDTNVDQPTGCIRRDECHSGRLVATRVLECGYRRVVWVTYSAESRHYSSGDRFSSLRAVVEGAGLPLEIVRVSAPHLGAEGEHLLSLLAPDTVVITEQLHFAQAVVNLAQTRRLAAGLDYGLASCDHSRTRATLFPDLSRVVIDRQAIGETAAGMLLSILDHPAEQPPSVVFRGEWYPGTTVRNRPGR